MSARYIFRMDDITPTVDWGRFWSTLSLFMNHGIKPLLGIVPDNRDGSLDCRDPHPHFWEIMRHLQDRDIVDFAQHGYQHRLTHKPGAALLGPNLGIKAMSEFAGEPYNDQVFKIREGQKILQAQGITTQYWMAPNHSFDRTTLRALHDCNFTAISDGISLFPFSHAGLIFVPQQTWQPRWMPIGVQTICLHSNSIKPLEVKKLRRFLRRPFHFSRFSDEVATYSRSIAKNVLDYSFQLVYQSACKIKQHQRNVPLPREVEQRSGTKQPLAQAPLQPSHPGN